MSEHTVILDPEKATTKDFLRQVEEAKKLESEIVDFIQNKEVSLFSVVMAIQVLDSVHQAMAPDLWLQIKTSIIEPSKKGKTDGNSTGK